MKNSNDSSYRRALQPMENEKDLEFDVFHLFSASFYQMTNKICYLSILHIYFLLSNYIYIFFFSVE